VDQELRAYLEEMEARLEARADERFAGLEGRVDSRFARLEARMDERFEKVETEGRHTRVLLEGMNDNVRLLAEGLMGVTERLEKHQAETARGFDEIKAMLSPYYRDLGGRAQTLEDDVQCLDRRVQVLEGRAERQTGDVFKAIREKFGKPQA
jgi:hypothetical protein